MSCSPSHAILSHKLPDSFSKHPNNPWKALQSCSASPYLLTADSFGGATNLWKAVDGALTFVALLEPSTNDISCYFSTTSQKLVVWFNDDQHGILRLYTLEGVMVDEVQVEGRIQCKLNDNISCDQLVIAADHPETLDIITFEIVGDVLKETRKFTVASNSWDMFYPLLRCEDSRLMTARTRLPSSELLLELRSASGDPDPRFSLKLPAEKPDSECLSPLSLVKISPTSFALIVNEDKLHQGDHGYSRCTIHGVTVTADGLTSLWRTIIPNLHQGLDMTYHPELAAASGVLVIRGFNQHVSEQILTFIDATDGQVLTQVALALNFSSTKLTRAISSHGIAVFSSSGVYVVHSLSEILGKVPHLDGKAPMWHSDPIPDTIWRYGDPERPTQAVPVFPEPYNAKAAKALSKGGWSWVDHIQFVTDENGMDVVVVLAQRGPELYTFSMNF
ncbi:hypothetical protein C8J56DRAFT_929205 [Mycena floridula]|nr:hypothetical protein C8J56DRAFT_929205 [Mycena floridula]